MAKRTRSQTTRRTVLAVLCLTAAAAADGLPGEYLVTQRWRDLFAGQSPLSNPAFLTEENYITVRGAFSPTLGGQFKLWEAGVTVPIGLYQSAAFSWLGEDDGTVRASASQASGRLVPTGPEMKSQINTFYLSYAINPWNRLSAGANILVAYQGVFDTSKAGVGGDLGVSYRALRHPLLGEHVVGVMFQNLVPPQLSVIDSSDNRYAPNLKVSWLGKILGGKIETGLDVDVKDFLNQGETLLDGVDERVIEYDFNYRIGTWLFHVANAFFQIGSGYWGLAVGLNVPTVNNGRDLAFRYQYTSMTEGEGASSHTLYLRVELGKHREEIYARRLARLASISPNDLYNKGRKLFSDGKFWDAYFVFGQLVAQYPEFFKNDWVYHYRGRCLEEMDMRVRANETYANVKEQYPRSNAIPHVDLGIMRVHYRDHNHAGVSVQMDLLAGEENPDSLRFHAYYLMGETHLRQGDYRKAIQAFERIPEGHPEYVFAQHSLGIAHILDLNLDAAMLSLENCLQARIETKAEQEVANRSALLLGYMFYEKYLLSKAVTALRMVPKDSYYYEDALLGLAWTALKASQWNDCIRAGKDLVRVSAKPVLKAEGRLLEAYGSMMQKNYQAAADALNEASRLVNAYAPPSEDSLANRRQANEERRMAYGFLSGEVKRMSLVEPSEAARRVADSLHRDQKATEKELTAYTKFVDEFDRRAFFARSFEKVRDDIEYAVAVVDKFLHGGTGEQEQKKEMVKEAEDLDQEILELEKQLKGREGGPEESPEQWDDGAGEE